VSILNSIWGLIFLAILAVIVFINAAKIGGQNGGQTTATILDAAGGSGSTLISTLEGNPYQPKAA
jgi:hypothetical protein